MDPLTILAAATAAFNGIKRAVEVGREMQDVYGQLTEWAGHVSDFHHAVAQQTNRRPGLFERITFTRSETAEALELYTARQRIIDMEKEIYNMFLYGALNHLGRDGYDEFRRVRREVQEQRQRIIQNQILRQRDFLENLRFWGASTLVVITGMGLMWWMISWALGMLESSGQA